MRASYEGRGEALHGHSASEEYQKQAVKDTEAMLQADRRYELYAGRDYSIEDCSELFSVFTGNGN